jgi:hypothetical protein
MSLIFKVGGECGIGRNCAAAEGCNKSVGREEQKSPNIVKIDLVEIFPIFVVFVRVIS